MAYNEDQRAIAVTIVKNNGGVTKRALEEIRAALNAPTLSKSTIHGWLPRNYHELYKSDPERKQAPKVRDIVPSVEARAEAADLIASLYERVTRDYLAHALKPDVIADMKGDRAVTAAAIATDKARLIQGLPTAIIQSTSEILDLLKLLNIDPEIYYSKHKEALVHALRQRDHPASE